MQRLFANATAHRRRSVARRIARPVGAVSAAVCVVGLLGAMLATERSTLPNGTSIPNHDSATNGVHLQSDHGSQTNGGSVELAFCVSASLEPLDGAVAQIRNAGPAEAVERLRRCLADTTGSHVAGTMTSADTIHIPTHAGRCFAAIIAPEQLTKDDAVQSVLECLEA